MFIINTVVIHYSMNINVSVDMLPTGLIDRRVQNADWSTSFKNIIKKRFRNVFFNIYKLVYLKNAF